MKLIEKIKNTPTETKVLFVIIILAYIFYSFVI